LDVLRSVTYCSQNPKTPMKKSKEFLSSIKSQIT